MLNVQRKKITPILKDEEVEQIKENDLIIEKLVPKTTYENGKKITEYNYEKVNLTKKINETKKLLKIDNTSEKIAELEKIFTEVKKEIKK